MTSTEDLPCQELVELVNDYLEDLLPTARRVRFERHLLSCPSCTTYVEQLRLTIAVTGRVDPKQLSPSARQALLAVFHDWADRVEGDHDPGGSPG